MREEPLLSIIVPVYNVRDYIARCLKSIEQQNVDRRQYEVIIVNDGTPDDSMEIATSIIERMENSLVIYQDNQGLSAARNTGLKNAKGDYIWFVDSDDYLLDDALIDVFSAIDANPQIDVIATVLETLNEETGGRGLDFKPRGNVSTGKEYMFSGNNCGASQRFIIRRAFLQENNLCFKKGVYHEDGDFGNRMLYLAKSIIILPKPVYCYLLRSSGSIMSSRKMKMNYDLVSIYLGLEQFCNDVVDKEDYWKFKYQIFSCLSCTILFSRNEIDTSEFKSFYREHQYLIHKKASELIAHWKELSMRQNIRVLHFYFFPLFYTRVKHRIKILLMQYK